MTRTPTNGNGVSFPFHVSPSVSRILESYTKFTYMFWYSFNNVLYQSLETGTADRTLIGLDQLLQYSGFSLYLPSLILYSPFKQFIA